MAHNQTKPLSQLLRSGDDSEPKKQSREEWRLAKELEEARKLGNAPAAVDETGKDINPHIPQYISTVPWYVGSSGPTLKHQRPQPEREKSFSSIHEGFHRGTFLSNRATKWRKGACENCGAMGHKRKDCMERPRARGARWTNEDIAPDDIEQPDLKFDFDGKRDRWNGYDPSQYREVVEEHRRVEEAKRLLKEQKLKEETGESGAGGSGSAKHDDSDDEDKYADKIDMPGTKVDSKQRITVRNLRIREDTAKYLRNLDPDSAHYDPKTRSMRDNPYKNTGKTPDEVSFAGENFVRYTGDTKAMLQDQAFAWEAHNSGVDIHLLAEPTKAALLTKEFHEKKQQMEGAIKTAILDRYGGEEHLKVPPRELLYGQTENYVEYSRTGQIIRGAEKKIVRSKYEEDIFLSNHTTVWGSYWDSFRWGYKCCHQFVKQSYCTGVAGKTVREEADFPMRPGGCGKAGRNKAESDNESGNEDDEDSQLSQDASADPADEKEARIVMPPPPAPASNEANPAQELPSTSAGGSRPEQPAGDEQTEADQQTQDAGIDMKRKRTKKDSKKRAKKRSKKSDTEDDANSQDDSSDNSGSDSNSSSSEEDSEEERRRKRKKEEKRAKRREKKRRSKKHKRDKLKNEKSEEKKLSKAIKRYEEEQNQETDERKRKYNSMYEHKAPSETDMEAYFLKRHRPEDPMAHFLENNDR